MTAAAELDALIGSTLDDLGLGYERVDAGQYLVRLEGEHKLATMTWLIVGDYTLRVEAFVMRCPAENVDGTYRFLLQRNSRAYGVHWSVDRNGDVFLVGHVPFCDVTPEGLDRLLGTVLSYSDGNFDTLLQLGFAEAIRKEQAWRAKIAAQETAQRAELPEEPGAPAT